MMYILALKSKLHYKASSARIVRISVVFLWCEKRTVHSLPQFVDIFKSALVHKQLKPTVKIQHRRSTNDFPVVY
jgi:hypothetical protein